MSAKKLLIPLLTFFLAACNVPDGKVRIKGNFKNIDKAEFYVLNNNVDFCGIDTIKIEKGKFSYDYPLQHKSMLTLLYPNFSETHIIGEPGKEIEIKGDASHLSMVEVSGTEENDLLIAFRIANTERSQKEKAMAAADFIRSHPKTTAAVIVYQENYSRAKKTDITALQLLEVLKKAQPDNPTIKQLDKQMHALISVNAGRDLPDFTTTTLLGKEIKKADFLGKPLVIAFWANWLGESTTIISELAIYQRKHPGQVNVLHISLDPSAKTAKQMIYPDTTANAVCDGNIFDSPLVKKFGVRYVPSTILVDKEGKVIARDLPIKELKETLSEL